MLSEVLIPVGGVVLLVASDPRGTARMAGYGLLAYWAYQTWFAGSFARSTPAPPTPIVNTPDINALIERAEAGDWPSVFMPDSKRPNGFEEITLAQLYEARDKIQQQAMTQAYGINQQSPWIGDGMWVTTAGNILLVESENGLKVSGSSGVDAYESSPTYADDSILVPLGNGFG